MTTNVPVPLDTAEQIAFAVAFNAAAVVDKLGTVKALIAQLEAQEEALKAGLIVGGKVDYEGTLFDAHVGKEQTRTTVKKTELEKDLGPLEAKYLSVSKPFRNVGVTAKK